MMKFTSCLVLGLLSVAEAKPNDLSGCIMSNTAAVNKMVDAALFIYVTNRNCKNFDEDAKVCVKDIASVVNSVTGIAEFMLKVFQTCGEIKSSNYDCAVAGTKLTGSLSSITANVAGATLDCPVNPPALGGNTKWTYAGADTCNVFIGGATSALQGAIASIMTVKGKCAGKHANGELCVSGVLDMVTAIAGLATCIENLATTCSHGKAQFANGCESDVVGILGDLSGIVSASTLIKHDCAAKSTRLYEEAEVSEPAAFGSANVMSAMLLAFLPIVGLASYYGGSRMAKANDARYLARTLQSDE
jgi:hypothetical protein